MSPTTAWEAVQAWPAEDRLAFALKLWDELADSGWQPEPSEELAAELDSRLAAHEADPGNVLTWEQILEQIRSQS